MDTPVFDFVRAMQCNAENPVQNVNKVNEVEVEANNVNNVNNVNKQGGEKHSPQPDWEKILEEYWFMLGNE